MSQGSYSAPCPLSPGDSAWVYFRDSGGDSQDLFSQKARVLEYCQAHQLVIERVFEDGARSGTSIAHRADFAEMVTLAQSSKKPLVKGIVCWDMSRFSRNLDDGPYFRSLFERIGYKLIFIANYIPEGFTGKVVSTAYDIANAMLSQRISADAKRGLEKLIQQGIQTGVAYWPGRVPRCFIGERRQTQRILNDGSTHWCQVIVPDRATWHIGRQVFEMRASRHTYEEIAEATGLFDEVRYGRKNKIANPMEGKSIASRVSSMLSQTIYKGVLSWNGEEYPGYVEAMVEVDLWQAANSYRYYRGEPFVSVPHPKAGRTEYLLSGLLVCGYCGGRLYGVHSMDRRNGKVYDKYYYKCQRAAYDKAACTSFSVSTRKLEPAVMTDLLNEYLDFDFMVSLLDSVRSEWGKSAAIESQIAKQQATIDDLKTRLRNLREQIERGDSLAWGWYREREQQLQAAQVEMTTLKAQQPPTLPYIGAEVIEAVVAKLRQMAGAELLRERQLVLQAVIDSITVERGKAVISYKLPEVLLGVYSASLWTSATNIQHEIELV